MEERCLNAKQIPTGSAEEKKGEWKPGAANHNQTTVNAQSGINGNSWRNMKHIINQQNVFPDNTSLRKLNIDDF